MKVAAIAVAVVAAIGLLVVIVGWSLPARHRAVRERTFPVPVDSLYAIITDVARAPQWRRGVRSVEIVPGTDGTTSFRETGTDGVILYRVVEATPGRRFVTRIDDPSLPFGGTWTFDLTPARTGATLRITEDGEVRNPIFRFASRFVLGHHATIDRYLADLTARVSPSAGR